MIVVMNIKMDWANLLWVVEAFLEIHSDCKFKLDLFH